MDVMRIESPESLLTWAQASGSPIRMDTIDAGILLDCCRSKGFSVGSDSEGRLYFSGKLVSTQMDLDDVIDLVCDWLYEDKQVARDKMEKTTDIANYSRWSMDLDCIQEMQREMNRLFEQTKYGRTIAETASKVADDVYQRLTYVPVYNIPVVDMPDKEETPVKEIRPESVKPEMQVAESHSYVETAEPKAKEPELPERITEKRVRESLPFEPVDEFRREVDDVNPFREMDIPDADELQFQEEPEISHPYMQEAYMQERRGR